MDEEEYVLTLLSETGRVVQAPAARAEGRFGAARMRQASPGRVLPLQRQECPARGRKFRWYHGIFMPP